MDEPLTDPVIADAWGRLRRLTPARIALGRTGSSLPTEAQLAFQLAHARARDAVHHPLAVDALCAALAEGGRAVLKVHSAAADRASYLQRPDLGRRLDADSRRRLAAGTCDVAFVIADGLSALAVERNAPPLLARVLPRLEAAGWTLAPLVVAEQGRLALGDEIAVALGARMVVVLIGERPGLSSPDSLGLYLTWQPTIGTADAERNCISNVRQAGLSADLAAHKLVHLMSEARARELSGIALRDEAAEPPLSLAAPAGNFLIDG